MRKSEFGLRNEKKVNRLKGKKVKRENFQLQDTNPESRITSDESREKGVDFFAWIIGS
jgi:hypothetical protein